MLLAVVLIIVHFTTYLFEVMQTKIDNLNASVQENLIAIRVVKSFVREGYAFSPMFTLGFMAKADLGKEVSVCLRLEKED